MNAILLRQAFRQTSRKANALTFQPVHSHRNALASAWQTANRSAGFRSSSVSKQQFLNASQEDFKKAISKEDSVVLVDFYADWCGPCKMLSPILEKLTDESADCRTGSGREVDLVTIDTDAHGELAAKYQVTALPTVIAFKDGEPADKFRGALPESEVRKFLERL
ncbi:thioredoxin-like protein [Schizopora paradoxa]|uniref:Thioredoxin-like protein n=1 Tax=Schizopora paradoxa TaxID=27342 RepID=A0A0H2RFI5_9AGAM|nr:thioredoxin-like protein [Schizopora paradoxa]